MSAEKWIVKIQGYKYETNLNEMKRWIVESRVLPEDLVFHKSSDWVIAKEVSALREAFEEQNRRNSLQKSGALQSYHDFSISPYQESVLATLGQQRLGYGIDVTLYSCCQVAFLLTSE